MHLSAIREKIYPKFTRLVQGIIDQVVPKFLVVLLLTEDNCVLHVVQFPRHERQSLGSVADPPQKVNHFWVILSLTANVQSFLNWVIVRSSQQRQQLVPAKVRIQSDQKSVILVLGLLRVLLVQRVQVLKERQLHYNLKLSHLKFVICK